MSRRRNQQTEGPGQDSFLDIVANLVGILIILVMVVGVRAKDAMLELETQPAEQEIDPVDVQTPTLAAATLEKSINETQTRIEREQLELRYRSLERDRLLEKMSLLEHQLNDKKQRLSQDQLRDVQLTGQLSAADEALADLKRTRSAIENAEAPPIVLTHIPTPLAKTVFGKEIHFRMEKQRVAFIPWKELVDKLKNEAPEKIWKLKEVPEVTEFIGPIDGFRMQYTLARQDLTVTTRVGTAVQRRGELDHFIISPVRPDLGEPLDTALQQNSKLYNEIRKHDPQQTTVTVWVYPDSYSQFRRLKDTLFRWGYLTASRPMPAGMPITASKNGTRSSAQ